MNRRYLGHPVSQDRGVDRDIGVFDRFKVSLYVEMSFLLFKRLKELFAQKENLKGQHFNSIFRHIITTCPM